MVVAKGDRSFCFFCFGKFVTVTVDDYLPFHLKKSLFTTIDGHLWVSLMEKAFAKLKGCYELIGDADLQRVALDLTGNIITTVPITLKKLPYGALAAASAEDESPSIEKMQSIQLRHTGWFLNFNGKWSRVSSDELMERFNVIYVLLLFGQANFLTLRYKQLMHYGKGYIEPFSTQQIMLQVPKKCTITIYLQCKTEVKVGLDLYMVENNRSTCISSEYCKIISIPEHQMVHTSIKVEPGRYILIPKVNRATDYLLRLFSKNWMISSHLITQLKLKPLFPKKHYDIVTVKFVKLTMHIPGKFIIQVHLLEDLGLKSYTIKLPNMLIFAVENLQLLVQVYSQKPLSTIFLGFTEYKTTKNDSSTLILWDEDKEIGEIEIEAIFHE